VLSGTGLEVERDEDYTSRVRCKDSSEKIQPLAIKDSERSLSTVAESHISALESANGFIGWVVESARPEACYRESRLQQQATPKTCTISALREANKVVAYLKSTSDGGLTFKAGAIDWGILAICVIADASFCRRGRAGRHC
jgi:hypothetical protein